MKILAGCFDRRLRAAHSRGMKRQDDPAPMYVDVRRLAALIGISERQIHRLVKAGELPRPIPLGERRMLYSIAEVTAAIESKRRAG